MDLLAEPTEAVTTTVSAYCLCRFCVGCDATITAGECACGADSIPEVECHGCVQDAREYVGVIACQWAAANASKSLGCLLGLLPSRPCRDVRADGRWHQRWVIEPWAGGSVRVLVYCDGELVEEKVRS